MAAVDLGDFLTAMASDFADVVLGSEDAAAEPRAGKKAAASRKKATPVGGTPAGVTPAAGGTPAGGTPAGDESFTLSTFKDHAKKKGMWAGALTPVIIPDLLGAGSVGAAPAGSVGAPPLRVYEIGAPQTPALLKIFDEIIVNALDRLGQGVTEIDIEYDLGTGRFSVRNDGPGLPVVLHAEATARAGHSVYVPEVAFSYFLAGTNIDKDLENVKGGINGLGAKLANVHSVDFAVETVDVETRRFYSQQWRDRLDVRCDPRVVDLRRRDHGLAADQARPHTRVSFVPAYAALGYAVAAPGGALAHGGDVDAWLRLRAHQAAAYAGPRVAVAYNGARCATTDAAALGRLLLGDDAGLAVVLTAQAKAAEEPYRRHPWSLAVIVLPPSGGPPRRRPAPAAQTMAIVNGVVCSKGSHVQYLRRLLGAAVDEKLRKATRRAADDRTRVGVAEALAGVRLVMCGAIPGADWGGQRKDELQVPKGTLERYALPEAFLRRVGDAVAEQILLGRPGREKKVVHDKYRPADRAGKPAHLARTVLMVAEGDSAMTLLNAGLTQGPRRAPPSGTPRGPCAGPCAGPPAHNGDAPPTYEYNGVISAQGVVPNAAREVTEVETLGGGEPLRVRSAKLQENKRLLSIADAFGLQYGRAYTTPEELATLNYGRLLLCVDQDLDGTGKIAALLLVWVYTFWPALIAAGRVGRFMTPLVRAYPRGRPGAPPAAEFYYEAELTRWLAEDPARAPAHAIKYYKGLATHDECEVKRMFAPGAFRRSVYVYTLDDTAKSLFEVYFGADPALRKGALVSPVAHLTYEAARHLHSCRQIPVGQVQLDIDTKAYKHDAISRQIPGGPDGLNPARRKVIMGAAKRFGGEAAGKELKIFQLGGYVADKCFYHHGDASLNSTIVYMAQAFAGARQFPYLTGVGQFGSRHGDKPGSARYISVKPSPLARAVFPPADQWHLRYVFEDGERAEPQYYVPVVPMGVLESNQNVSEGWNHVSHGRDLAAVLAVVAAYIGGDPALTAAADRLHAEGPTAGALAEVAGIAAAARWPLPASTRGFDGEVRPYRGEDYSFGVYGWDHGARTVTITELPMGLTTAKYLETLAKVGRAAPGKGKAAPDTGAASPHGQSTRSEIIESVANRCSADKVDLEVVLRAGAFEQVAARFGDAEIDPIEDALKLRASLRPHLNYYGADGSVLEFGGSYLAAVLYWAPLRRDLYATRLAREQIVAELCVLELEQVIRFIGEAAELVLASVGDDAAAAAVLRGRGFPPLNRALLHRPEYTPNADLRRLVTSGPGASHDYLLDLRERDLVLASVARRREALAARRAELARVTAQLAERPVPGASVWRAEVADFVAEVERARA